MGIQESEFIHPAVRRLFALLEVRFATFECLECATGLGAIPFLRCSTFADIQALFQLLVIEGVP